MTIVMGEHAFQRAPTQTLVAAPTRPVGAPVLCICGYSGAGKTTLIEAALHELDRRGLAVAVIKHDAHGFSVDRPGKDSDRFFRAGATVVLGNANEQFQRRGRSRLRGLDAVVADVSRDHDLVLVEGHKATPLPKLWLASEEETRVPEDISGVEGFLARDSGRIAAFLAFLDAWMPRMWRRRPIHWVRLDAAASSPRELVVGCDPYAMGGGDATVDSVPHASRLPIAPDLFGPTAALVAAYRWLPHAAWMVIPPAVGDGLCTWLAAQRRPGV